MLQRKLKFLSLVLFPAIAAIIVLTLIDSSAGTLPFNNREKFVYTAKWGVIEAGEAVIETLPSEYVNGRRFFHFVMTTQTNGAVDRIYKIRERQDSYVDQNFTHSVQYEKRTMGKHPREVVVYFNWRQMNATYVNFGEPEKPVSIVPGTFDPLSMFFVIRTHELRKGTSIQIPITDGKKLIPTRAVVKDREKIVVNERTYDTYVVVPDFDLNKAFEKDQPDMKIWITADDRRIPVKIESRQKFGKLIFELVSAVL
jgi:hypothetical protein